MGGSNQSLFLIGTVMASQGGAAVPLMVVGLMLSWMAAPGWIELTLMWPDRVGGIAAVCAEAFRPYSAVLANLTGVCYWWGWLPECAITAMLGSSALHQWYLPHVPVTAMAIMIVMLLAAVNLCGLKWASRLAMPMAIMAGLLALLSGLLPVLAGTVDWHRAASFHLVSPFQGTFGGITSAMAGLYLIGFAAPAFEAAACHVGEMRDPVRNLPRAMYASASMATLYFLILPVIWLGVFGSGPLRRELSVTLGPTFAPLFGSAAKAAAIWFLVLNLLHGVLQPLSGASRTLLQLGEDGLLPRIFAHRISRTDAPWFAIVITAMGAAGILLMGAPIWIIAAANFTYLIGICLPSVAVALLRRNAPERARPYRARRGMVGLGVAAASVWGVSTILGFEQFGLPAVLAGLGFAYSGAALYVVRVWRDRVQAGTRLNLRSLHVKLTGAMLAVLSLDGTGYLLAISSIDHGHPVLVAVLQDIFVAVALLTVTVGLVLPGMIAHLAATVADAARTLGSRTIGDLTNAMEALAAGDLAAAYARADIQPIVAYTRDELGEMAATFNAMQADVARAAVSLDGARDGVQGVRAQLEAKNRKLASWGSELEQRVQDRTAELQTAHDQLKIAHDELAALATTDPVTGLPNHRALISAIEQEIERSRRYRRAFTLLFLDIDYFKTLNDTYGHHAGDEALRALGTLLKQSLRAVDTTGRWGGEEFVAVLPETGEQGALAVTEQVREAVAAHAFGDTGLHITCSIGLACYPVDGRDRNALIDAADRAMYTAKSLGRNQAFTASDPAVTALKGQNRHGSRDDLALTGAVQALAMLVDIRDAYTGSHALDVSELTLEVALQLGCATAEARMISMAGKLHDVGKVAVPDAILRKPGRLTDQEWAIMHKHPVVGAEVVSLIPALRAIAPVVRSHHEHVDGTGYPDGLKRDEIPLGPRIVAVVDAFSAMTTDRPYRDAIPPSRALEELRRHTGTQFDPAVVDAFEAVATRWAVKPEQRAQGSGDGSGTQPLHQLRDGRAA